MDTKLTIPEYDAAIEKLDKKRQSLNRELTAL